LLGAGVDVGGGAGVDVAGGCAGACEGVLSAGGAVGLLVVSAGVFAGVLVAEVVSVAGGMDCVAVESGADGSADISGPAVDVSLVSGKNALSVIPLEAPGGVAAVSPQAVSETITQDNIMIVNILFCIKLTPFIIHIFYRDTSTITSLSLPHGSCPVTVSGNFGTNCPEV